MVFGGYLNIVACTFITLLSLLNVNTLLLLTTYLSCHNAIIESSNITKSVRDDLCDVTQKQFYQLVESRHNLPSEALNAPCFLTCL
jgi:hypothetical protein